jgi:hypothetical protein
MRKHINVPPFGAKEEKHMSTLHRDLYRLCRPYCTLRNTNKVVGTARRLLTADPTPDTIEQWVKDLRLMVDVALAPSPYIEPTDQELKIEIIARRLEVVLNTLTGQQWIERMRDERVA